MIYKAIKTFLWKAYILKNTVLKRRVFTELKNIAKTLEEDIFAKLREDAFSEAFIEITATGLNISPGNYFISTSKDVAAFFRDLGISTIELDCYLESNQIMDILKDICAMKPSSLPADGYNAYCAITAFSADSKHLSIRYHYCELDYSKAIRGFKEKSGFKDHRVFFQRAPLYAIIAGIAVMLQGVLYSYLPIRLSLALSIALGMATGIIVFIIMQTIGSLEYDKEYLERRLKIFYKDKSV